MTLLLQPKMTLQVEYFQPFYLQLRLEPEKPIVHNVSDGEEHEHLPGYLPDDEKVKKPQTIARMQIPFTKLAFIKFTFGDKIVSGKGCFLDCLYSIVQVLVDPERNLCRLCIPDWGQLEDINVRQLSYQYFKEQKLTNLALQEKHKYLGKKAGVKQIIGGALQESQEYVFQGSVKAVEDKSNLCFKEPSKSQVAKHSRPHAVEDPLDLLDRPREKRLQLNNQLLCHLKFGKLAQVKYTSHFAMEAD